MKRLLFAQLAAMVFTSAWAAGEFPNSDLVLQYFNSPDVARATASSCKGINPGDAKYPNCWGAGKALELFDEPADTRALILNRSKRKGVQTECDAMSMKERFQSRPCQALVQATNFFMFLGSPRGNGFIHF